MHEILEIQKHEHNTIIVVKKNEKGKIIHHVIHPGAPYDKEAEEVQEMCKKEHTEEAIAAYRESLGGALQEDMPEQPE